MTLFDLYPSIIGLNTRQAAKILNRQPQTLRKWAIYQNGPIQPIRVNRRLLWLLADLQRAIDSQ